MKLHIIAWLFCINIFSNSAIAGILPDYDKNCDYVTVKKMPLNLIIQAQKNKYFSQTAPKIINRIWFGDPRKLSRENRNAWQDYAKKFGYKYRLWTEADEAEYATFMKPENLDLLRKALAEKQWWAASDVLRLELMKKFGGIYVDCDFKVPTYNGEQLDFFEVFNNKGLTLMAEPGGRNIGTLTTSTFVNNSIMIAAPGNYIINYLVDNIHENAMTYYKHKKDFNAMYATGPFFVNKALNGNHFTAVPWVFMSELKMWP
jgi:hypothetical protein